MGWKAFKDKFDIRHMVHVAGDQLCIGFGYEVAAVRIDVHSGEIWRDPTHFDFLGSYYPAVIAADPKEIVATIAAADVFETSVTVYGFEGAQIVEKQCETPGWPNTTFDGRLMFNNEWWTDRDEAVRQAKRDVAVGIQGTRERIAELQRELRIKTAQLSEYEEVRAKLEADHPEPLPGRQP